MGDAYDQIIEILSRSKRVLVTTHVRPDGDALGSVAAMVLGFKKKGIDSQALLLSHLPRKYAFIFNDYSIPFVDVENGWPGEESGVGVRVSGLGEEQPASAFPKPDTRNPKPDFFKDFDALLVIDTGTWSQLPGVQERIANLNVPKLVIDHHLTQENWATIKLVDTKAAAAGEIVGELLQRWGAEIDSAIATALYLAIVSDTGWFQFSNTRPHTMRLAADLMEAGVDTDRLYQLLYQNERPERVALQTRVMNSLELLADGKLAVMRVYKKDFEETRASVPDTENLINVPLQIRTVQVAVLITEPLDNGPVRVSLRSKGQLDVAKFAEQFGGGGHARASGLKIQSSFGDAHDKVVGAMAEKIQSTKFET